jgi:hypothetical protein
VRYFRLVTFSKFGRAALFTLTEETRIGASINAQFKREHGFAHLESTSIEI